MTTTPTIVAALRKGDRITDAEWALVRTSGFWRHIPDGFASYGNDVITDAVASLLLDNNTENDR